jgi:glycosyltransferase involved in cell wall biosynthesis
MATGLPVVSTRLPGSTDSVITDGANGRLVPPDDVDALRGVLSDVLSDRVVASAYGTAARETVCRRYSLGEVSRAYLQIYEALWTA